MSMRPSRLALGAIAALLVAVLFLLLRSTAQGERATHLPAQPGAGGDSATPVDSTAVAHGRAAMDSVSARPQPATASQRPSVQVSKPIQEEPPQDCEPGIRLMPPPEERGSLLVQLVDPEGEPVTGASISLHRPDFCDPWDSETRGAARGGKTDGDGRALINRLAGGAWHVVATSTGTGISWRGKQPRGQAHVATNVKPEGQSSATVVLDVGFVIAGRVTWKGRPREISVIARSEIGCEGRACRVEADGTFRIDGLCRGPWRCWASAMPFPMEHWAGPSPPIANSAPVRVTESREDVELTLPAPSTLTGRMPGMDLEHAGGIAANLDTGHRYELRFEDEEFWATGLDPGTYMVIAHDAQGWAVQDGIQVEEGSAVTDIEIAAEPEARVTLPASAVAGRTSFFLNGVRLPEGVVEWTSGRKSYSVPPRHLDVELRLDGRRHSWTVDAISGQTLVLDF